MQGAQHAHTFCFDFDEGAITPMWDDVKIVAPATFAEDGHEYTSPPNSALLANSIGPDGGEVVASIGKTLPAGRHIHCEIDVRIDETPLTAETLLTIRINGGGGGAYYYHASLDSGGGLFYESSMGGDSTQLAGDYVSAGWHRALLDVALIPANGGADAAASSVGFIGGPVGGATATLTGPGIPQVTSFEVQLGFPGDIPASSTLWDVRFDDVACDVSP
jgi:hypothetical protein